MLLWNAMRAPAPQAFTNIGGLRYCIDVPFVSFSTGEDICAAPGAADAMFQQYGYATMVVTGSNDKGDVLIGRAGGATTGGFAGAIWIEGIGWMKHARVPAQAGRGRGQRRSVRWHGPSWMRPARCGSVAFRGNANTFLVNAEQVYVCKSGQSVLTGFPGGLRDRGERRRQDRSLRVPDKFQYYASLVWHKGGDFPAFVFSG